MVERAYSRGADVRRMMAIIIVYVNINTALVVQLMS
jgi:hypothetical protein